MPELFSERLQIGWHLIPQARRQGFATEAAKALLAYAMGTLQAKEVYILTETPHEQSQVVARRLGLVSQGRTDEFYDIEMTYFIARRRDMV